MNAGRPLNDDPTWYSPCIPIKEDAQYLISYVRSLGVPVKVLSATGWDWIRGRRKENRMVCCENFGFDPSDVLFVKEEQEEVCVYCRSRDRSSLMTWNAT